MPAFSRDHYRQIVELSGDSIFELDGGGRVVSVNQRGLELLEAYGRHDVVGRHWHDLWTPAMRAIAREAVRLACVGQRNEFQGAIQTLRDQERIWSVIVSPLALDRGQPVLLLAMCRDVTDRLRSEHALRLINESLTSQLQGAELRELVTARHADFLESSLTQTQEQAEAERHAAEALRGQVDIAEAARSLAERARDSAELASLQAQKGEAVGQLVAGIAHDFNNMLQTAVAAISVVTDTPEQLTPLQRKLLGRGQEALHHASMLARRLLAFSRRHPPRFEALDLREVATSMAELMRQSLGPDMVLVVEPAPQALITQGDPHAIGQAVMNLCINARDACQNRGQITVSFSHQSIASDGATPSRASGQYVVLSVADTGTGMDQATLSRLFEPYFTTKPEGQGTGLGLAQVYALMRHSGGFIDVDTALGRGTVMSLWFPQAESASAHAPVAIHAA
ncbi:PAS domain S-box protein [Pseudoxanthomonas winnipegensis]|jgi:PAS domain S-box-containing protein|uniref:histidine kinase n=2 Tax=Pseudoxanthomonas winnipegensis TaxID=2480810 RepID=A0A4Q8LX93_9GAMM|nr:MULTISPECIES: ATP-binding protein [Pseudoxanthomonas]MDQ1118111.1 PAS domain S-box-containing protein [Pseudoxanthomonas winnipegensis]MDQ1135081.1 PAS domain S-box-containing protein [Pseudoxanthomonas winnipegensis]MDR6138688.1 PAS domain S-box-containing protein [Pseudoxanthomonas sp. SORGH_AS_0997]TAA12138.1 PAS domain S-box protein [Pseudoxanthomonas winnipegensis]TAA19498.1 PAS domain S-box protein [Pseudoxanthomonas winnipegensis]